MYKFLFYIYSSISSSFSTETGNLIDLNSDSTISPSTNLNIMSEHNYVNDSIIAANRDNHRDPASLFDVFDMRKRIIVLSQIS